MDETMVRKAILGFLQENALELRRAYLERRVEVIEAKLEENPMRLVVVLDRLDMHGDPPKFEHMGVEIVPEVVGYDLQNKTASVVIQPNGTAAQVQPLRDNEFLKSLPLVNPPPPETPEAPAPEEQDAENAVYHVFSPEEARALGISEAIGPHSRPRLGAKDAYEAWKARHKVPGK